jgi:hypothetical protein
VEEVLQFVRVVRNPVKRREYFDLALDALRVEEEGLRRELWKAVGVKTGGALAAGASSANVKEQVARAARQQPTVAEQRLLELLLHDEELRHMVLPHMEPSDYEELPTAAIFRALVELEAKGAPVDFATLSELTADDAVATDIVPLLLMSEPERAEGEATDAFIFEAENCLRTLRLMHVDRRIKELAAEIAAADRAGEAERRDRLIMEDLEWKRRRSALALLPRSSEAATGASSAD